MPTVVVFDMDDTLYLEADFVRSGFRAVDTWLSNELNVGDFFAEAWRLFEGGRRGDIFDVALSAFGLPATPDLIRKLIAVYRDHLPTINLAPDAFRVLARRADYLAFAVLTDGYEAVQRRKINVLKLEHHCSQIILTDRLGSEYWKPHPRGFLLIQDYFDLPASSLVYVADNPVKDFVAPRALGWKTIRIKRDGGLHSRMQVDCTHDADLTIASLDELASGRVGEFLDPRRRTL